MDAANIADLFSEALFIVVVIVTVIIGPSLVVGLIVATFQAATQINEQTLSFLPRLIITLMVLIVTGPWIVGKVVDFTNTIIFNIPILIG
ncbi:flagellar export apparatus protein FliQ [Saccharospirillum sp. MSK14-1]|uniref:flagellar biosynthesis protein FliQ n=1 Tax=Saccharospirillum sp. MSK14-1 TaxID=1897632 RepID=UPI000D3A1B18|nr:flagellar biosynthesis protein FliQ [Saccharospirillum sp. MSK14-1]PTY36752.1 flagellar export apparatus protein FliQ [Saccharospirillum sp. MSK14-1]